MGNYVLTDRGKIAVAVLIMFFLVLPSIILVIWLMSRNTSPSEIHPDVNGIYHNNDNSEIHDPSFTGLRSFDLYAGEMSFFIDPDSPDNFNENIVSMVGELLSSHGNTAGVNTAGENMTDSKIAVGLPQLIDEKTSALTKSLIDLFDLFDVSVNDIMFFIYQTEPDVPGYIINISIQ